MRVILLEIQNYRSIKNLKLECSQHSTLLGPNNHGKSNILSALEFGLSTSSKPVEEDFFAHREEKDNNLWVEMNFCDLTEQERTTFKRYILADGNIAVRKTASLDDGKVTVSYNGWLEEPEEEWLRFENAGNYTTRDKAKELPLYELLPTSGRITKADFAAAQEKYIKDNRESLTFVETLESGPLLGSQNVGGGVLPELFLIPAIRDLTDEMKIKSTTTFGRLVNRAVSEMAEKDPQFIAARQQLVGVVSALNERDSENSDNQLAALEKSIERELEGWGVKVDIEVKPPEIEKLFELGTDIHLDDGVRTTANRKGNGLQRAMIFALLRSWASVLRKDKQEDGTEDVKPRKQSNSIIFAMEEPELFLHPHAQRRLSEALRGISNTPQHQVFISSHSTHFVDLSNYEELAIVSKNDSKIGSQVRQCTEELFTGEKIADRKKRFHMAQWINPERGEMFFARRAIFVEGETEKVVLPFLAKKLNVSDSEVSLIDCGSKHNLPLYVTIANAFDIPFAVVHDEDPLPDPIPAEWNGDKIRSKNTTFGLNAKIAGMIVKPIGQVHMMSPDFEGAAKVSKNQGYKMGKALASLEHFEELDFRDIPKAVRDIVVAIYG